jgi:His-Xaa-Ser system protein HxsD
VPPERCSVELAEQEARIRISISVYPTAVALRALYWLTDRAYVLVDEPAPGTLEVRIRRKPDHKASLEELAGEFCNALVDQAVRAQVAAETRSIRELIFAKAFAASGALENPPPGDDRDPVERLADE